MYCRAQDRQSTQGSWGCWNPTVCLALRMVGDKGRSLGTGLSPTSGAMGIGTRKSVKAIWGRRISGSSSTSTLRAHRATAQNPVFFFQKGSPVWIHVYSLFSCKCSTPPYTLSESHACIPQYQKSNYLKKSSQSPFSLSHHFQWGGQTLSAIVLKNKNSD